MVCDVYFAGKSVSFCHAATNLNNSAALDCRSACISLLQLKPLITWVKTTTQYYFNMESNKRGAFIVFEGCDRVGKSTQSNQLCK